MSKSSERNAIFASDNSAGVHPKIRRAINAAGAKHAIAYGKDRYTETAVAKFQEHFGKNIDVYFVFGGTGANVLGLQAITEPFHAIICADDAHINVDECGAPERFTGCKLLPVQSEDGKISIARIEKELNGFGDQHHVQPRVISISQSTELGTVYTAREVKALAAFAHDRGLFLHMDGARICNAAVSLGLNLKQITADVGVDVLSFGGAKNGMMYGEAIVFFDRKCSEQFKFIRKQGAQLPSKMRFISAQFEALLSDGLWQKNAEHANRMAALLARELRKLPEVRIVPEHVDANAVFAILPKRSIDRLLQNYFFHVWNEDLSQCRFMTAFDTTLKDVEALVAAIRKSLRT